MAPLRAAQGMCARTGHGGAVDVSASWQLTIARAPHACRRWQAEAGALIHACVAIVVPSCYADPIPTWRGMLSWDEEFEIYECTAFGMNHTPFEHTPFGDPFTYCSAWTTFEDSADEWEKGSCVCTSSALLDTTGRPLTYCHEWRCEQQEISKCDGNEPEDWPYTCYECDEDECWVVGPTVDTEISHCVCDLASVETTSFGGISRQQCTSWHCTEGDEHSGGQAAESEAYYGHTRNHLGTVTSWSGRTDSIEEFERAECQCTDRNTGQPDVAPDGSCCTQWFCHERGLRYHYPYPLAIIPHIFLLPVFAGVVYGVAQCCVEGCDCDQHVSERTSFVLLWSIVIRDALHSSVATLSCRAS